MTTLTIDQIKAAWEAVAAARAASGTALLWKSWEELPPQQVTACRALAALAAEFRAEDARTLGRAAHAAWRVLDDPSAQVARDYQDARKVDADWAALAEALQEAVDANDRAGLERVVPPDLDDVRRVLTSAQQGEIEGWSQETQLELLWRLARHVDGLLAEVATARDTVPARSEADVLRAAAGRFRRAAAMHEPLLDDPDSKKWHHAYSEAADCLETWALNGGVPPLGKRLLAEFATARDGAPEVDRGRPAGPWEPAPDTPGTQKPATPPRGPSGASPSADGTAR